MPGQINNDSNFIQTSNAIYLVTVGTGVQH